MRGQSHDRARRSRRAQRRPRHEQRRLWRRGTSIGKIDEATYDVGASYVVVDTGPWIFGKKVMLPAGVIQRVDLDSQKVFVDRTKDEIKNSPEFDQDMHRDKTYRSRLGSYYFKDTER